MRGHWICYLSCAIFYIIIVQWALADQKDLIEYIRSSAVVAQPIASVDASKATGAPAITSGSATVDAVGRLIMGSPTNKDATSSGKPLLMSPGREALSVTATASDNKLIDSPGLGGRRVSVGRGGTGAATSSSVSSALVKARAGLIAFIVLLAILPVSLRFR
jgi:hypothetical protein